MRELLSESLRGWGDKTVVKQTKKQTNKSNKGILLTGWNSWENNTHIKLDIWFNSFMELIVIKNFITF